MGVIMNSREEKNKKYVDEIKREKLFKFTKIFLKVFGVIIFIFTMIFLYSYFYEPKQMITHEYLIKDISIPDEFNGTKVLHFTDLLYGKTIDNNKLAEISEEIELINPDIVIFTGNIISNNYEIHEDEIKILNEFFKEIPYKIGKYAIMGDTDTRNFKLIMENTDFTIIENEVLDIFNGINKINLIGINYNDDKEIKNIDDNYTITIINNYDDYDKFNISSNLVFAGHNLGGEIRIFNIPLLGLDKHLDSYYYENNTKVYISNGLGSIHHMRLMNKPSMNVYRLYNK